MATPVDDNRDTCGLLVPSSCIPYTGYISNNIKSDVVCRPNINDILKQLQDLVDSIKITSDENATAIAQINTTIATINAQIATLQADIDPNLINLAVNLLCMQNPSCEPKTTYTLPEVITALITNYCSLLTRVQTIEQTLNL